MIASDLEQIKIFFVFFISGSIIGIFFDIFRIIRKSFKISDLHTIIEDIIFITVSTIFLIFIFFIYNDGTIRWFMIFAIFIGIVVYNCTISKLFIKANVKIIKFLNKVFSILIKIAISPFKILLRLMAKIFKRPYMMLTINIKKKCTFIRNILLKERIMKNNKKSNKKRRIFSKNVEKYNIK